MDFQDILLDISDGIATITLNRPDKLNAFTGRMMYEIIAALDITDADDNVKVVIFTGAGRAFCAGADLSSGGDTFAKGGSDVQTKQGVPRDGGGLVSLRIYESLKPVIGTPPVTSSGFHASVILAVVADVLSEATLRGESGTPGRDCA
jgi:enoyl-CoA hydratase/carnithine racemase